MISTPDCASHSASSSSPVTIYSGQKMERILVIEDSQLVQAVLAEIFQSSYQLDCRHDGLTGLAAAQAITPDLILLDIHLPGMDGYAVCRALKADEQTREIPIIFITSFDSEENRVKGFEAGGDDYVVKPFYKQELQARVKAHLSLRQARQQALSLERLTVFKEMAVAICHEINNPLTSVFAFVHHLQTELSEAPPSVTTALEGITQEITRIRQITGKLAASSRAQRVKYNKDIGMIDLHNL